MTELNRRVEEAGTPDFVRPAMVMCESSQDGSHFDVADPLQEIALRFALVPPSFQHPDFALKVAHQLLGGPVDEDPRRKESARRKGMDFPFPGEAGRNPGKTSGTAW